MFLLRRQLKIQMWCLIIAKLNVWIINHKPNWKTAVMRRSKPISGYVYMLFLHFWKYSSVDYFEISRGAKIWRYAAGLGRGRGSWKNKNYNYGAEYLSKY